MGVHNWEVPLYTVAVLWVFITGRSHYTLLTPHCGSLVGVHNWEVPLYTVAVSWMFITGRSHYTLCWQDGSCNGLQHYAALGRDQAGAASVNLAPSDRPMDVYSDVVELVERQRVKDAAMGDEVAQAMDGFVRRKVGWKLGPVIYLVSEVTSLWSYVIL